MSRAAQIADPDPWRNELRAALDLADKSARLKSLQGLAKRAKFAGLGPISLQLLGTGLRGAGDAALAESVLRRAQQRHSRDAWINFDLGGVLAELGRRDEATRKLWRTRAQDWFRADLKLYSTHLKTGSLDDCEGVIGRLQHWKVCTDLAPVRDPEERNSLPDAERQEWQELWGEIEAPYEAVDRRRQLIKADEQVNELAATSQPLLDEKKWAGAEPLLRRYLAVREKTQHDAAFVENLTPDDRDDVLTPFQAPDLDQQAVIVPPLDVQRGQAQPAGARRTEQVVADPVHQQQIVLLPQLRCQPLVARGEAAVGGTAVERVEAVGPSRIRDGLPSTRVSGQYRPIA